MEGEMFGGEDQIRSDQESVTPFVRAKFPTSVVR